MLETTGEVAGDVLLLVFRAAGAVETPNPLGDDDAVADEEDDVPPIDVTMPLGEFFGDDFTLPPAAACGEVFPAPETSGDAFLDPVTGDDFTAPDVGEAFWPETGDAFCPGDTFC